MDERRVANRLEIVRFGRHYCACGLRGYCIRRRHAAAKTRGTRRRWFAETRAGLLPGATLALIVLFSVFVLERPPLAPDNPQQRTPIVGVAHYTFADFANISH